MWKWTRNNKMSVLKDLIDKDWTTKDAISALVREKIEKDWQMQKVITDLLIEKGNDWQLQQVVGKAANKVL
jgi:hypothetical protein